MTWLPGAPTLPFSGACHFGPFLGKLKPRRLVRLVVASLACSSSAFLRYRSALLSMTLHAKPPKSFPRMGPKYRLKQLGRLVSGAGWAF